MLLTPMMCLSILASTNRSCLWAFDSEDSSDCQMHDWSAVYGALYGRALPFETAHIYLPCQYSFDILYRFNLKPFKHHLTYSAWNRSFYFEWVPTLCTCMCGCILPLAVAACVFVLEVFGRTFSVFSLLLFSLHIFCQRVVQMHLVVTVLLNEVWIHFDS